MKVGDKYIATQTLRRQDRERAFLTEGEEVEITELDEDGMILWKRPTDPEDVEWGFDPDFFHKAFKPKGAGT